MTHICTNCGTQFKRPGTRVYKFCSPSCSGNFNGKNGLVGGDTSSLEKFISLYGEEDGKERYKKKWDKYSKSKTGMPSPLRGRKLSSQHKKNIIEGMKNSKAHQDNINKLKKEGMSEEAKNHLRNKMKGTFTLEWFKNKYGEEDGILKYEERSRVISKNSYFKIYNKTNRLNYSKKSQKLFWELYNRLCLENKTVYFGELNHEYSCGTNTNFDFVLVDDKKVIEFNGNIWHANPKYFAPEDFIRAWQLPAKDVWKKDQEKNNKAIAKGFEILVVWESDFDCNKKQTIENCVKFLTSFYRKSSS